MKYFCLFKRTYKLKYTLAIMNYSNKNHKIIMNVMNDLLTSIETKSDEHIIKRINQHKNKSLVKIMKTQNLSMEEINARITSEICHNTLLKLSDENLLCEYMNCPSVKNEIAHLGNTLDKYVNEEIKQQIIKDYLLKLIPAGTKGNKRGGKFNAIVKDCIEKINLNNDRFEICFEKKCEYHITSEIPDWYVREITTNKIIIGMNQLDLWNGGQQINRGFKYLEENKHNNENSKLLCVVCNPQQFKSKISKVYKLFKIGFENNTLCYINNLQNIITSYFN